jgi:hypothetical protein
MNEIIIQSDYINLKNAFSGVIGRVCSDELLHKQNALLLRESDIQIVVQKQKVHFLSLISELLSISRQN